MEIIAVFSRIKHVSELPLNFYLERLLLLLLSAASSLATSIAEEAAATQWQEKIDAFGKEDYAEIVGMAEQFIPNDVKSTIAQSDIGPALAYEISKDPALVASLHN